MMTDISLNFALAIPADLNPNDVTVRVAGTQDKPLWCLADLCKLLGVKEARDWADRIDEEDRVLNPVLDSRGVQQKAWFVNESGLYTVLIRSDKPAAKPFRKWVTGEVLPSIRKYGCYPAPATTTPKPSQQPEPLSIEIKLRIHAEALRIFSMEGMMEERDRLMLRDGVRNLYAANLLGSGIEQKPTRFVQLPDRAAELGYHVPRSQVPLLGKAVAAVYRLNKGCEPPKHDQYVDGRICRVNTYSEDDLLIVDAGIRHFFAADAVWLVDD